MDQASWFSQMEIDTKATSRITNSMEQGISNGKTKRDFSLVGTSKMKEMALAYIRLMK